MNDFDKKKLKELFFNSYCNLKNIFYFFKYLFLFIIDIVKIVLLLIKLFFYYVNKLFKELKF